MEDVSVVIPAYNSGTYIAETLESVLKQSRPAKQIIVVDDGSTDNTSEVVGRFGAQIELLRTSNSGVSHARNLGLQNSKCDWVAFLDSDDIWHEKKIERCMQFVADFPNTHLLFSDFCTFGLESKEVRLADSVRLWRSKRQLLLSPIVCVLPSAAIVNRNTTASFPEWAGNNEDSIFFNDVADGGPVVHLPEILVSYRKHSVSAQSMNGSEQRAERNMLRKYMSNNSDKRRLAETMLELLKERRRARRWQDFDAWSQILLDNWPNHSTIAYRVHLLRLSKWVYRLKDMLDDYPLKKKFRRRKEPQE